ncbi:MAG TPA: hypothetical protein VGQ99_01050 [Tepidisphaeraceae bacterium]|nr:hypothetical protein [Tepidisphaeraceae bacterium]
MRSRNSIAHSEGGAAAAPVAATNPVSALMAGQVLRDGELILLLLRPSRWFILLTSLRFLAIVAILMALTVIFDDKLHGPKRQYIEAETLLIVGRLTWAVLQWMGRLYILTDLRIIRLSGVFHVDIFDCPLRKVARTLLEISFQERLCRIGTIAIIPQAEEVPIAHWQMVAHPRQVHEQIIATISRAKQGGSGA